MKKTILFVPGFVVDVYSEIEASFVELCAQPNPFVDFVWLVPSIQSPLNRFAAPANRERLREPVWMEALRRNGIRYVVGDIHKFGVLHNIRLFRRLFREYQIDAVYTHFGLERFWSVFLGKLWGKTTVWNEHWHSLGNQFGGAKAVFYRMFVDAFISVSDFITTTLPGGIPVWTIRNAIRVEPTEHSTSSAEGRARLGLPANGKIVLMVAEFRPDKRHMFALQACRAISQRYVDTNFVFLGDGVLRTEFVRQVRAKRLERVFSPGHVHNVADYYAVADVCILTSHYEPFGYCVLEAMKYGVPMVAFDCGGPAEIIVDGRTGMLVAESASPREFADIVSGLLGDDDRRKALGQHARDAVRRDFNREAWIRRLVSALNSIASGPPIITNRTA